ncbi:MAG TPA: alpha/beta hydrolase fold domain-containing protein [Actinophytocola sp.]|uniref:alpha/beta hydrolase fold domain-containing protein n=1 Tax=Actinophytocola sp. TaxID=1872138 RepID=UPI002DB703A1|nr:alpha/beta hydrolase fold domain-containing protein [Actinophytocola sp.]HEU5470889.1 alpha/beta hydrolase fold domain-containing protein [Actinophytocola sp.]
MSVLGNPRVAAAVARGMQVMVAASARIVTRRRETVFPEFPGDTARITIPTPVAPAPAVVYRPAGGPPNPPVHVNFHGGGFVLRGVWLDDPLCRYLAARAGVVVVNMDYVVAPRYRFPAPVHQAFEAVRWIARHGAEHGWDGTRLTVGGQSAGGSLAAAAARLALAAGEPPITLQVLHYPPLDLATPPRDKRAAIPRPRLRPWMGEVFDGAYLPDPGRRTDPLASPAGPADDADLTGIAPALVITAEYDRLRAEAVRYADRLAAVGALAEHHDVPGADHGYDIADTGKALRTYALIARHVEQAVGRP